MKAFLIAGSPRKRYNYHLTYGLVHACLTWLGIRTTVWTATDDELPLAQAVDESEATHLFCLDMQARGAEVREIARKRPHLFVVGSILDLHYLRERRGLFDCCDRILVRDDAEMSWMGWDWRARSFPFAVDLTQLPQRRLPQWSRRNPAVYFRGALRNECYKARQEAVRHLRRAKMLVGGDQRLSMQEYYREVMQYRFGLTCSGSYGLRTAKSLEYAACGTMVLHDKPECLRGFLPHSLGYTPGAGVVEVVRKALQEPASVWEEKAEENRAFVRKHHTTKARAEQLAEILEVGW